MSRKETDFHDDETFGSYLYSTFDTIYGWVSSTSTTTNELLCYGSQEKRSYFPFNIESIKITMCKFGNIPLRSPLKIWTVIEDNNGKMECYIYALDYTASSRRLWEQSALELKCRDKEFTECCFKALKICKDKDERNMFLSGISLLSLKYKNEKKYRHTEFFHDLYQTCKEYNSKQFE